MKAFTVSGFVAFGLLAGCGYVEVNDQTTKDMPSGFLCEMLGPNWIGMPDERISIYRELETRNYDCVATEKVIVENR